LFGRDATDKVLQLVHVLPEGLDLARHVPLHVYNRR
jgi:hypothetical protein